MAKRISSTSVNWPFILEALLPADRAKVYPLKVSAEKYLREISGKPAELPKIDWNFYKSRIGVPGMVDAFQKSYESMQIPYPSDQGVLSEVDASNVKLMKHAENMYAEVLKKKEELEAKLKELEAMIKFSEATIEEVFLAKPEYRNDPDNPKHWPHLIPDDDDKVKNEH